MGCAAYTGSGVQEKGITSFLSLLQSEIPATVQACCGIRAADKACQLDEPSCRYDWAIVNTSKHHFLTDQ